MRDGGEDPRSPRLPPGLTRRHPTEADLDAVTELLAAASRARTGSIRVRREDLRMRWLGLEGLHAAVLLEDPTSRPPLVAYAAYDPLDDPWTGEFELHVDGQVHPDHTGRGAATALLAEADERARRAAREHGRSRVLLRTSLDDGDDRARAFFTDRGFQVARHLLELRMDLHAPPPRAHWPVGTSWRAYAPDDETALWRTHQAAFADVTTNLPSTREDFLADRLRSARGLDPELTLLAEHAGEPIGVAICRAGSGVAAEDGWVRDLGVVPAWRRCGIGMALLRTAFGRFRARGLTGVALEVDDVTLDGAVALYRRAGMRIVHRTDVLDRSLTIATRDTGA